MKRIILIIGVLVAFAAQAALDNYKNFSYATLSAGIDDSATEMSVVSAAALPTPPFNAVVWNATDYSPDSDPNREFVRVTEIVGTTLTITRAQESTIAATHNTAGKTYMILATVTAKLFNDDLPATYFPLAGLTNTNDGAGSGILTNMLHLEVEGDLLLGTTNVVGELAGKQPLDTDLTRLGGIGAGASGDILIRDATGWTNLVKGTDGEVLKLTSGLPSWETDSAAEGGETEGTVHAPDGATTANRIALFKDITGTNITQAAVGVSDLQPIDADLTRFGGIGEGAEGDVLYRDATGWTNLVKGTDGQVLKLSSGLPAWAADGTESSGTVHATGTPAANELMMSSDTTGTNLIPSGIITDGSGGQTNTTIYADALVVPLIDGVTLTNAPYVSASIVQVDDDAYAAGWNGSTNVPTKNAVYDKVELLATSASVTANTNLLHLNVGTFTVTNRFKTLWTEVTLDDTNAVLDLKLSPNFYWTTTTSNYLTFSNITAGAQGSILIYTPDEFGEQINFSSDINNLSTNRYAPVFQSTNQTWIGYSVTFGTDLTNVTVGITVK